MYSIEVLACTRKLQHEKDECCYELYRIERLVDSINHAHYMHHATDDLS